MNKRELIDTFKHMDFHPSHKLGQNFLVDRNLAAKLVSLAGVGAGDSVFEVGPGMGMITRAILETGATVTAIEKDTRLLQHLLLHLDGDFPGKLQLLQGDAVELPLGDCGNVDELTVIANPPFAITGPWLAALLNRGLPECLALILQKEAVARILADEGCKEFGVLSIRMQAAYEVIVRHPVPPQSFHPTPTIDSQIVVLRRKERPVTFCTDFLSIVRELFQQRRKQIGGRLRGMMDADRFAAWEAVLLSGGFSPQSRPEQVPLQVWIQLARH